MPDHRVHELALAFGKKLRSRRRAQHISMAAAADAAGMSRLTWHRIENGETGVAWRFVLAAAIVVGLDMRESGTGAQAADDAERPSVASGNWLPLKIQRDEFPGLQRLGWQISDASQTLTPREAWEIYERNRRHLDRHELSQAENALIDALESVYGTLDTVV